MIDRSQECCSKKTNNCYNQREHFNYLRNNSCGIWGTFNWGDNNTPIQDQKINLRDHFQKTSQPRQNQNFYDGKNQRADEAKNNRHVSFDDQNQNKYSQYENQKKTSANKNKGNAERQNKKRPYSATNQKKKSRLVKDQQAEAVKNQQNRQKVADYIEGLKPYTRGMSNTKFQDYYGKAAPECYGRANTRQPMGGIIYGNHLKSFNINPHVYTNKPEYYQTHTTAINYGKRTKFCEDAKLKRLQKQLCKKLGLKQKNQTIKQGKQIVYVDVDDNNKYQVMKQNHEFSKANKEQIHNRQLEYKKQKQMQHQDQINQYYAKKKQRIADSLSTRQSIDMTGSSLSPQEFQSKLNQQTIYRYHDKNGNVRLAADRHGMTCFVDMNFPENEAAYVDELKNRSPIFPIRVEGEDRYIDSIRKSNCKKGHEEIYPSHYLLRNCEQPQALKMLSNKTGVRLNDKRSQNVGNNNTNRNKVNNNYTGEYKGNKSNTSTVNTQNNMYLSKKDENALDRSNNNNNSFQFQQQRREYNSLNQNKSQILDRAWGNRQVAGQISGDLSKTCCAPQHLPHNQMNPQCYRNSGAHLSRIPYAG